MELQLLKEGKAFRIYDLCWGYPGVEYCPVLEFLEQVSDSSRKSLLAVIQRHSERGAILNIRKSRSIEDGIFEFKSRPGDRLLYFYSPIERGVTIITHGFHKGARLRTEIQRAINYRTEYLDSLR